MGLLTSVAAKVVECKNRRRQRFANLGTRFSDQFLLHQFLRKAEIQEMQSFNNQKSVEEVTVGLLRMNFLKQISSLISDAVKGTISQAFASQ